MVVQEVLQRDESLEDEKHSGWPSKVDSDQLRAIIEADPLKTTQEITEELNVDHSTVIWYLKQIGKVKKLGKWEPHELAKNQKHCHFEVSSSLFLHNNNKLFLNLDCDVQRKVDIIQQSVMTSSVVGPRSSRALSKAKQE